MDSSLWGVAAEQRFPDYTPVFDAAWSLFAAESLDVRQTSLL